MVNYVSRFPAIALAEPVIDPCSLSRASDRYNYLPTYIEYLEPCVDVGKLVCPWFLVSVNTETCQNLPVVTRLQSIVEMDFDEDGGPPDLVETGLELADEEKPVKVPITIVTGAVTPGFRKLRSPSETIWQDTLERGRQRSSTIS